MVLLIYFLYLLFTITHGHQDGGIDPSSWPLQLIEQDLSEKTGQPERIPINIEHLSWGTPTPFIQEEEPAQQKPRREKRDLNEQMQHLASTFRIDKVQQCCRDGHKHYEYKRNCEKTPNQLENQGRNRCNEAFKYCCFYAMDYYIKPLNVGHHPSGFERYVRRKVRSKDVHILRAYNHSIKLEEIVSPGGMQDSFMDTMAVVRTSLDAEIDDMATQYENYGVRQCCIQGNWNYSYGSECMWIVEESQCSAAFYECCSLTQEFFQKPRSLGLDIHLQPPTGKLKFKIVENSEEKVSAGTTNIQMQEEAESVLNMSPNTLVEISIAVASMYQTFAMKQCCYDGYIHYLTNSECMRRPEEDKEKKEEKREWPCHATFQKCCFRAQDYLQKPNEFLKMNLTIFEGNKVSMKISEFEVGEEISSAEHGHVEAWGKKEESLKEEMRIFASNYKSKEKKRCCHDGYQHYIMNVECLRRLDEKETEATRKCYDAFRDCCFHAQNYLWYFP